MKAGWQNFINIFLYTLSFVAIHSCFPCKHCQEAQCMLPGPGVTYGNDLPDNFTGFSSSPQVIPLKRKKLHEISGIAASLQNRNILYLNQDNGHPNCIYLTNNTGADLGKLVICNSSNRDWEDLAVGPGPVSGRSYIYVADIGDNNAWHCNIRVYRFPEPDLTSASYPLRKLIKDEEVICLQYPDRPHNAEAILIDPLTRNLYIATKEDDSSRIYVASFPQSTRHKIMLEPVLTLPFRLVTGGTISSNGQEVFLRSEDYYWYWKRAGEETIAATLSRPPQQITPVTKEPQGEAICFAPNQQGYFTCSEVKRKKQPFICFYKREF